MQTNTRRKFIITQQLQPGLINGLLNGGIAWIQHHNADAVGLWSQGSYATDLLATGFLLPAISWLIVRPLLRHQSNSGKAPVLCGLSSPWLARWMLPSLWGGAAVIGLLGLGLVGGGGVLALQLLGSPSFVGTDYAVFKGAYGALLTIVLQPVMVFAALAPHQTPRT